MACIRCHNQSVWVIGAVTLNKFRINQKIEKSQTTLHYVMSGSSKYGLNDSHDPVTFHGTHCVHTSMNLRKKNEIHFSRR